MVLLEGNQTTWSNHVTQGGMDGWHYDEQGFLFAWIYPKTDQQLWHGYFSEKNCDQNVRKNKERIRTVTSNYFGIVKLSWK